MNFKMKKFFGVVASLFENLKTENKIRVYYSKCIFLTKYFANEKVGVIDIFGNAIKNHDVDQTTKCG